MKGLIYLTLAGSLLASSCAFAQTDSVQPASAAQLNPSQQPGVARIAGRKFFAVDGSTMTLLAFDGGIAREIDGPGGVVSVETFALQNENSGTVSAPESGAAGTFRLTDAGIVTDYGDGASEMLIANGAGGVSLVSSSPSGGSVCTAWYPQDHRFTSEERQAAVIQASELVAGTPHKGCGSDQVSTREAKMAPHHPARRIVANPTGLQTAMASPRLRGHTLPVDFVVAGK